MTDILDRAYTLSEGHKLCQLPDDGRDALALLPEMIAEIKRLRVELQSYIEHEEQTHERLSAILGDGDSLEELAKHLQAERDAFQRKYQWMVNHAADQRLDGYRELGERAANAEAQLQAVIYDEEAPEWTKDYHLLNSALDGPIIEAARKWHQAYRKAQNSNLIRKQQNEQRAAYVVRLEAAYLDEARENIQASKDFRCGQQTPEAYWAEIDGLAREALEKIRGEQE